MMLAAASAAVTLLGEPSDSSLCASHSDDAFMANVEARRRRLPDQGELNSNAEGTPNTTSQPSSPASQGVRGNPESEIPRLPRVESAPLLGRFELLQQFEGTVTAICASEFTAILRDKTDPDRSEELGTFVLDEVSPSDLELVKGGAVFYWYIGYRTEAWGQRKRESLLKFRRLPAFSRRDLTAIERQTAEWARSLGLEAP